MTEQEPYIMKRTEILCVECKGKKLMHEKGKDLYCDNCGTEFEYTDYPQTKTFRYRRY